MEFKILIGPEVVAMERLMPVGQQVQWPIETAVVYAIEGDSPVGRMALMSLKVLEGSWVSDEKRGSTIAYRMMKMMEEFAARIGDTHLLALVYDEQPAVAEYLRRVNFERFPVTMMSKELVRKENVA